METLSLNDVLYNSMYEEREYDIDTGMYSSIAADIAEKFVREIAIDFGEYLQQNYIVTESKEEVEEEFDKFLKQKYGKA